MYFNNWKLLCWGDEIMGLLIKEFKLDLSQLGSVDG
jgi:hypothetical protein